MLWRMATIRSIITRWLFAWAAVRAAGEVTAETMTGEIPSGTREHPQVRFEPVDVDARKVLYTGIGVVVGMAVITALVFPVYRYFEWQRAREAQTLPASAGYTPVPPEPRLQQDPRRDLDSYNRYQEERLEAYQWIDRSRHVVSIPIERAMELTLQRGIAPRKAPAGNVYFNPREGSRLTGFENKVEPEPR
jgi:hypothetical protein